MRVPHSGLLAIFATAALLVACDTARTQEETASRTDIQSDPTDSQPATIEPTPSQTVTSSVGDFDGDTIPEDIDNCPGIPNPDQSNLDRDLFLGLLSPTTEAGDACDDDIDGDYIVNEADDYPFDTDNDGIDNVDDDDDDNDGVPDDIDNCPLLPNSDQADMDADGFGDKCDGDADDDGYDLTQETTLVSDPLRAESVPEWLGIEEVCSDGIDNDLDGDIDEADSGCADSDGDGIADLHE